MKLTSRNGKIMTKNALISLQNRFLDVETTFHYIFSSSDLQCLPPGDPKILCAQHRIRLLATHSLDYSVFCGTHVVYSNHATRICIIVSKRTFLKVIDLYVPPREFKHSDGA